MIKSIGSLGNSNFPKISFEGGWFANKSVHFSKNLTNTDWGSVHVLVLYGFFKLILSDADLCDRIGMEESKRSSLIEKTAYSLLQNLCSLSSGDASIVLPDHGIWTGHSMKYDNLRKTMYVQQNWNYNHYQMGNILDMLCYADMAKYVQNTTLPNTPSSTDWKGPEVEQVAIEAMDYMLGVNPWDVSMIYGIGAKNFNHPHHRASNPEGRNDEIEYSYRPPVGALYGATNPDQGLYEDHYNNSYQSEPALKANAIAAFAMTLLSSDEEPISSVPYRNRTRFVFNENLKVTADQKNIRLKFSTRVDSPLEMTIFNTAGRIIYKNTFGNPPSGKLLIPFSSANIRTGGFYLVRVEVNGKMQQLPVFCVK